MSEKQKKIKTGDDVLSPDDLSQKNQNEHIQFKKPLIIDGESLIGKNKNVLRDKPRVVENEKGYFLPDSVEDLLRFHPEVVLYCPQIPQNTGSIARMCAAFNCNLHLIEPMAFSITEKGLRRAGLDYWDFVNVYLHKSWDLFKQAFVGRRFIFVETGGNSDVSSFAFQPGDVLIFGAETFGIHKELLEKELLSSVGGLASSSSESLSSGDCALSSRGLTTGPSEACLAPAVSLRSPRDDVRKNESYLLTLPMYNTGVRSLNLPNTVSIVTYTAISYIHKNS